MNMHNRDIRDRQGLAGANRTAQEQSSCSLNMRGGTCTILGSHNKTEHSNAPSHICIYRPMAMVILSVSSRHAFPFAGASCPRQCVRHNDARARTVL